MADAKPLRDLLTFAEDNPSRLDLTTYGETGRPGAPVADLAGHALLLSGRWELVADGTFRSPEDGREISRWHEIEAEACAVLGLSDDELWDHGDTEPLFSITGRDEALTRLRELTEEAEAVRVNG